jgi:hypothetical protein
MYLLRKLLKCRNFGISELRFMISELGELEIWKCGDLKIIDEGIRKSVFKFLTTKFAKLLRKVHKGVERLISFFFVPSLRIFSSCSFVVRFFKKIRFYHQIRKFSTKLNLVLLPSNTQTVSPIFYKALLDHHLRLRQVDERLSCFAKF